MRLIDRLRSIDNAFAHRVRAALTLLGIVIGTGSIVLLASLLAGGEAYLVHASQEVTDEDVVEAYQDEPPPEARDKTSRALSREDARVVGRAQSFAGALVAAESSFDTYARIGPKKKRVAVVSSGASTMGLYKLTVERGRALDAEDRAAGTRVCVIGHEVYEDLHLGDITRDGARLEIDGHLFSVVGVLAKKPMLGSTDSTYLWDRKVMVPESTYDALWAQTHEIDHVYVKKAGDRLGSRRALRRLVLDRHFGVANFALSKDQSGGMEELILDVIRILLLGTGVLALVASGINIMNVMLVTVSERTREIGLRRAIGATPRSILVQFLLEAAALSSAGAAIGVVAGIAVSALLAWAARAAIGHFPFVIAPWSIAVGAGLAVGIGLAFGILPAIRAARITPIEALRSE